MPDHAPSAANLAPYGYSRLRLGAPRIVDPTAPASTALAGTATPPVPHERHRPGDERHYRRLADAGVCGVIFWTLDGPLLEANDEFLRMCGHTRDDLDAGLLDWRTMTPPDWVEVDQRHLAALREAGMHEPYEKEYFRKDGSRVPVLVGSACFEETPDRGVSFILDLSDRKRASADAAFLAEASGALASSLDYTTTLAALARTAVPGFADACVVDMLADGDRTERVASAYRDPELERLARELDTRYPPSPDAAYGPWRVMRTGVPQLVPVVTDEVISHVAREATHRALVERLQLRSLLIAPILSDGRVAGALTFVCDARGTRRYDARDLPVALELAHRASVAIDHARLYAAERAARERAERAADRTARLQRVTEALGGALTPEEVGELIVRQGLEALGADASFVARLSEDRQALEVAHAEGYEAAFLAAFARFPLDAALPAAIAARSARPLWLDAHEEFAGLAGWQVRDALPAHAVIPLVAEGQVLGVIGFGFRQPHTFAADDKVFLEALAQLYVQSLRRAELFEAERRARALAERAARRATALQTVTAVLADARTPDDVADAVLQVAFPVLGASRGSVGVLAPDGATLEFIGLIGHDTEVATRHARVPIDAAFPPADAAREGVPILLGSSAERRDRYPHLAEPRGAHGAGALAAVPLIVDGHVTGALGFNFAGDRTFDVEEEEFLLALARQCAQALERARLLESEAVTLARTARLQVMTAALSRAAAPGDVVAVIVREGLDALAADAAFAGWWTHDSGRAPLFALAGSRGLDAADVAALVQTAVPPDDALARRQPTWLESRKALGMPDVVAVPYESWVFLPLVTGGEELGLMGFGFTAPRRFTREEHALAEAMAERCTQALERSRLLEAERRARGEADARQRRASFLAEASRALASSLEVETTLRTVATHAVPALADWCAVDLLVVPRRPTLPGEPARDWPPEVQRLVVAHADPARVARARELEALSPRDWTGLTGLPRVLREGVTEFHPVLDDAMRVVEVHGEEELARLGEISATALIIAPLVSRGRILGAVTLCMSDSGRHYEEADRMLAEDLASRVAAAIENAALFHDVATANRAKADFLAVMSHELRTPINAMLGYTDLLDAGVSGVLSETQRTYVQRAREAARRLLGHVEDVLMYARLEAGHVAVQVAPVTVRELLEAVVPIIAPQAAARHLALDIGGADGLSVRADRDRAAQVLLNLLSNAIKFTPEGGRVRLITERPTRGVVAMHVQDTGPGIPPEKREVVFEPFVQLDTSHTRRAGGTGLGLSISRDLARAMGGEIAFGDSGAKVGATFTFLLPEADPSAAPDESASSGRPPA